MGICPECGKAGKEVSHTTLRSMLQPAALARLNAALSYRFCRTEGCTTVYFPQTSGPSFYLADVKVRVGQKNPGPPTPVCYCFHFSTEEIAEEIQRTGTTTIPEQIAARIKAGECACEVNNPQGSCCLGNVRAAAKLAAGQESSS